MGKLNILRHKKWHVGNQDNLDKVRRDEAVRANKEADEQKRALEIEREIRLDALRSQSTVQGEQSPLRNAFMKSDINAEENVDYKQKKRQQELNFREKNNLMWRLQKEEGRSSSSSNKPWYSRDVAAPITNRVQDPEVDIDHKIAEDPMRRVYSQSYQQRSIAKTKPYTQQKSSRPDNHNHNQQRVDESYNDLMALLRRERVEREQREKKRSKQIV
ncbi:hypothetical protein MP228_009395 [Amoeboaphelidium protococcarum]|nr:hypothetical protein MP228_009395 [Amoeboaphelidium protococcarum]